MYLKHFLLLTLMNTCSYGMNYQFSRKLYDAVLSNYTRHVKPRQLSSHVVNVNIDFSLHAVIDYDEKSGVLKFMGTFIVKWWDEMIMWNKTDYGNIDMIQLSIHDVWVPKIVIGNSVSYHSLYKFDNYFDSKLIYVTYLETGSASFTSSGVWETSCNNDVRNFPFDHHECVIQLDSQEPLKDIKLTTKKTGVYINYTVMHSEFKISRTSVQSGTKHMEGTWSQLTYTIQLERQPLFMMMNLVVPIYIISVSNLLVFLLPLDSSDRVAFSVTMLLTFTVFMSMVTDELPATDTLSNFNIFLLIQMVFSTVITICVLLIHYIYKKGEEKPSPKWLNWIVTRKSKGDNQVNPIKKDYTYDSTSRWKSFARLMNKSFLITFSVIILCEFVFFYCTTAVLD